MKISILSVHNHGNANEEFVLLKASQACDLSNYILADTTYYADGKISAIFRHTKWFTSRAISAGDYIKVFTKVGTDSAVANQEGSKTHLIYWDSKAAIWNNDGDGAILFEIGARTDKKAK